MIERYRRLRIKILYAFYAMSILSLLLIIYIFGLESQNFAMIVGVFFVLVTLLYSRFNKMFLKKTYEHLFDSSWIKQMINSNDVTIQRKSYSLKTDDFDLFPKGTKLKLYSPIEVLVKETRVTLSPFKALNKTRVGVFYRAEVLYSGFCCILYNDKFPSGKILLYEKNSDQLANHALNLDISKKFKSNKQVNQLYSIVTKSNDHVKFDDELIGQEIINLAQSNHVAINQSNKSVLTVFVNKDEESELNLFNEVNEQSLRIYQKRIDFIKNLTECYL